VSKKDTNVSPHSKPLGSKVYAGTVDLTPRWGTVIDIYIAVLENSTASHTAKEAARSEIRRLATIADAHNETMKASRD